MLLKKRISHVLVLFAILGITGFIGLTIHYELKSSGIHKILKSQPPHFLYALYGDQTNESVLGDKTSSDAIRRPLAVTVAPDGTIFVADSDNSQIQKFDSKAKKLLSFGRCSLNYPFALVYKGHKLYVADPNLEKIFVFDDQGKELPPLLNKLQLPLKLEKLGEVICPTAIQIGPDGLFYITDVANQSIVVLSDQGQIVRHFGSAGTRDGEFKFPNGLWIDNKGVIYVADSNNARIQVFDSNGNYLSKLDGQLKLPRGLLVTEDGIILVVDVLVHCVRAFDLSGNQGPISSVYVATRVTVPVLNQ